MQLSNNELDARIGRLMAKVVFKENTNEPIRWFWQGRPEQFANHTAEQGLESLRFLVY